MVTYEVDVNGRALKRALNRVVKTIRTGKKPGADNLELYLQTEDYRALGPPFVDVLNRVELDYKQGKPEMLDGLAAILKGIPSKQESKMFYDRLIEQREELRKIARLYTHASNSLELLEDPIRGQAHIPGPPQRIEDLKYAGQVGRSYRAPPSTTQERHFLSLDEINDLYESVGRIQQQGKAGREDFEKVIDVAADKYADVRNKMLWNLYGYGIKRGVHRD